jgi:hypothetical protein
LLWLVIASVGAVVSAAPRLIVIELVRALPAPSVAMTVIAFAPVASVTLRLQFAVLLPVAVPPVAALPLTVTLVMPLPPAPLSVAVPLNVMLEVVTVWPLVWLVIASVGAVVSDDPRVIVIDVVRALPTVSVATTVKVFAPVESDTLRLQFAVLVPDAVPPVAAPPFTVTLWMPLLPAPLSVAVPLNVIVDVVTV